MRYAIRLMLTTALVLPFGFAAATHGAGAATGTSCKKSSGSATFKPALPQVGAGTTVKPKVTVKKGKTSGCKGGGVKSGTISSVTKFNDPTNCDILLNGTPSPHPPSGTLTVKWNTGTTSAANVTLNQVSGQPTQTDIEGTISTGTFAGMHLSQTISFAPKTGDCVSTPLSAVTFSQVTALKIS